MDADHRKDLRIPAPVMQVVAPLLEEADANVSLDSVLAIAGVSIEQFHDPEYHYDGEQLLRLLRLLRDMNEDEPPVKVLLRHWSWSSLGMAALAGMSASSVADSAQIARQFCHAYMPAISIDYQASSDHACMTWQLEVDMDDLGPIMLEATMVLMLAMAHELAVDLPPHTVHFAHHNQLGLSDAQAAEEYASFLNCEVVFSSDFSGIREPYEFWHAPYRNRNVMTRDMAVSMLRQHAQSADSDASFCARVRSAMQEAADKQHYLSLNELADLFHLSPRTLIRRLAKEGLKYKALLADVRFDRAKDLLQRTNFPIKRIAASVGYADSNAFARAFKNAVGVPPGKWREQKKQ